MPKENRPSRFDLSPTLFRDFATECTEIARRTSSSNQQRIVFLEMTSMWEQLAQSWERKQLVREEIGGETNDATQIAAIIAKLPELLGRKD
jgi:hypothetical protein